MICQDVFESLYFCIPRRIVPEWPEQCGLFGGSCGSEACMIKAEICMLKRHASPGDLVADWCGRNLGTSLRLADTADRDHTKTNQAGWSSARRSGE